MEPAAPRHRVWVALLASPFVLGLCFAPAAVFLTVSRGLEGEALAAAMAPIAVFPATVGFSAIVLLTRWLARRDGLSLEALGWRRPGRADVAVALLAVVALVPPNTRWLFPLVQRLQPGFDPTAAAVSLPALVVTLVVASVAEDTLYRGYALEVLRRRHGAAIAVAITSVLYALITPAQGLPLVLWAATFGAVLAALKLWRGNLWVVSFVHVAAGLTPRLVTALWP